MMWTYLILFIASAIVRLMQTFQLQPVITLPSIFGIDVDAFFLNGMGLARSVFSAWWVLGDMFIAALVILSYYILKNIALRFFFGHRTPGH